MMQMMQIAFLASLPWQNTKNDLQNIPKNLIPEGPYTPAGLEFTCHFCGHPTPPTTHLVRQTPSTKAGFHNKGVRNGLLSSS